LALGFIFGDALADVGGGRGFAADPDDAAAFHGKFREKCVIAATDRDAPSGGWHEGANLPESTACDRREWAAAGAILGGMADDRRAHAPPSPR